MSLDRILQQLSRLKLSSPGDELSIGAIKAGPYIVFGDATGETVLIAEHDHASRMLSTAARSNGQIPRDFFWSGKWLEGLPFYRGFENLWDALPREPRDVSVAVPRSSERMSIGRAKKLDKDLWLFESENGEYALVPSKETARWILGE